MPRRLKLQNIIGSFLSPKHTAAEQRASKQPPLLFSMYTPTGGRRAPARVDAPPSYTSRHCPISQCRRVSSAAEKALFSFFSFAPAATLFLLARRSAMLPMCARGGT